jgi:glutamate carboxypeptidase
MNTILDTLKDYVDLPSFSHDKDDASRLSDRITQDFKALGFKVNQMPGKTYAPTIVASWGQGARKLLLMGHMDTVFPRERFRPFSISGDSVSGSGVVDMKGGIAVMVHAVKRVLPLLNADEAGLIAVINADEEVGSEESTPHILAAANKAFAALSFEPSQRGALTVQRKGVTAFRVDVTGIGGHAGSDYKKAASAIKQLIIVLNRLDELRDDTQDVSLNIGVIGGGTAENVVADKAFATGEFRSFDPVVLTGLRQKVADICNAKGIPGTTTTLTYGQTHPACKETPESLALFSAAQEIAKKQGRELILESTGGAGDISIAAQAGIPVLDGLGIAGEKVHTALEKGDAALLPLQVDLAAEMIIKLFREG